ncbi:Rha family transcriptional regulator [uncultured Thiocystis sp.]|jgi:phage regulator Rha-like protein|uniref:Rha family transcriptional regulator n=1 Tax=uncultured Thiocystis sp. TaxID=1202134 RepID=UPI0025DE0C14|nr:Rha family transcriptional regulator [uncultured Thiocystis sp.]
MNAPVDIAAPCQTKALVEIRGQQATTTSLAIADGCKLAHKQVLAMVRKYRSEFDELGQLAFETRVVSAHGAGQSTEIAILNEDQATYAITLFRNSPIVRRFKLALVKAFRKALNEIGRLYANPPRQDIIKAKRAAHNPMMAALIEIREDEGKATDARQFMCENRLCNWVITGRFEKLDESSLSNADAVLLEHVRDRNRALILAGLDYQDRKARLMAFATRTRAKLLTCGSERAA